MRIIAGSLRGRRLKPPNWPGLRPTSDKLRETLFNILADRVAGARVLDAFAGTGALGIEAISRGAAYVVFVDRDRRAIALIADNVRHCGVSDACVIIRADLRGAVLQLQQRDRFDLILLDPPYDGRDVPEAVESTGGLLTPEGRLVLEHARRTAPPVRAGALRLLRDVASGDSGLAFYGFADATTQV